MDERIGFASMADFTMNDLFASLNVVHFQTDTDLDLYRYKLNSQLNIGKQKLILGIILQLSFASSYSGSEIKGWQLPIHNLCKEVNLPFRLLFRLIDRDITFVYIYLL